MDDQKVHKASKQVRNAWIAGLISAVITFAVSFVGAYNDEVRYRYGYDTWMLFDVALILGLTFGMYKKNRFSALFMLIYFLLCKISEAAATGTFSGGVLALVFGYIFFRGTLATFQLHKHAVECGQIVNKKRGPLMYISGGAVSLVILAAGIFLALLPPIETEVIPGKYLKAEYANILREMSILDSDERVLYWYSDGLWDIREGFYFFTNKKVVVYSNEFDDPAIIVPHSNILGIDLEYNPSFSEDSQVMLLLNDGTQVSFPLSSEKGGDRKFYDLLLSTWQKEQGSGSLTEL